MENTNSLLTKLHILHFHWHLPLVLFISVDVEAGLKVSVKLSPHSSKDC